MVFGVATGAAMIELLVIVTEPVAAALNCAP